MVMKTVMNSDISCDVRLIGGLTNESTAFFSVRKATLTQTFSNEFIFPYNELLFVIVVLWI